MPSYKRATGVPASQERRQASGRQAAENRKKWLIIPHRHFEFEDVIVEVTLELFVRKVDAKLLEGVAFENLKPENIQHANCTENVRLRLALDSTVQTADHPIKGA